jgi:hypothetical protein
MNTSTNYNRSTQHSWFDYNTVAEIKNAKKFKVQRFVRTRDDRVQRIVTS